MVKDKSCLGGGGAGCLSLSNKVIGDPKMQRSRVWKVGRGRVNTRDSLHLFNRSHRGNFAMGEKQRRENEKRTGFNCIAGG